jgi:predicted dehydrogenase
MNLKRICIVGAGEHSTHRIYPYIGIAGGQLVGVCDLDINKASSNAQRFGGAAYVDIDEMLSSEKPDGIIICIGPEEHAKLAIHILKRGIPVYTEKPPAMDSLSALEVARASHDTGVLCTTAFKKRYSIAYERAKKWIQKYPEEDLNSLSVDYASAKYPQDDNRISFLRDFAIHAIDLACFLFGDVRDVFCFSKGVNAYSVSLRFVNGAVGSMNLNDGRSFSVPTEEVEITVKGGNFISIHNSSSWKITENGNPCEWREPPTFVSSGDSGNETGHLSEIADFFNAIQEGHTTRSNIYESYKTMVLYEAIKESAESEHVINIKIEKLD